MIAMLATRTPCRARSEILLLDIVAFGALIVVVINALRIGLFKVERRNFSH